VGWIKGVYELLILVISKPLGIVGWIKGSRGRSNENDLRSIMQIFYRHNCKGK
jgi:hypothetical protein